MVSQLLRLFKKIRLVSLQAEQRWVDKGSEFYNRSMKPWLKDNDTELYLTLNEEKYVVTERFI